MSLQCVQSWRSLCQVKFMINDMYVPPTCYFVCCIWNVEQTPEHVNQLIFNICLFYIHSLMKTQPHCTYHSRIITLLSSKVALRGTRYQKTIFLLIIGFFVYCEHSDYVLQSFYKTKIYIYKDSHMNLAQFPTGNMTYQATKLLWLQCCCVVVLMFLSPQCTSVMIFIEGGFPHILKCLLQENITYKKNRNLFVWKQSIIYTLSSSTANIEPGTIAREDFGHIESINILLVLNPIGYMLTSSSFALFI